MSHEMAWKIMCCYCTLFNMVEPRASPQLKLGNLVGPSTKELPTGLRRTHPEVQASTSPMGEADRSIFTPFYLSHVALPGSVRPRSDSRQIFPENSFHQPNGPQYRYFFVVV